MDRLFLMEVDLAQAIHNPNSLGIECSIIFGCGENHFFYFKRGNRFFDCTELFKIFGVISFVFLCGLSFCKTVSYVKVK